MGVALYGAYAADVNLDSSALKDAVVDCCTTWDGSELKSPTVPPRTLLGSSLKTGSTGARKIALVIDFDHFFLYSTSTLYFLIFFFSYACY